jgi:hypothetical protein
MCQPQLPLAPEHSRWMVLARELFQSLGLLKGGQLLGKWA